MAKLGRTYGRRAAGNDRGLHCRLGRRCPVCGYEGHMAQVKATATRLAMQDAIDEFLTDHSRLAESNNRVRAYTRGDYIGLTS
jgi:hypothetical protein